MARRITTAAWRQARRQVVVERARAVLAEANTTDPARLSQDWPQILGRAQAAIELLLEVVEEAGDA